MEPKNCQYCGTLMRPTKKHYAYQWAEKKFCSLDCKVKASVETRTKQREKSLKSASHRVKANKSRVIAMKHIEKLIRIKWTHSWWEHE